MYETLLEKSRARLISCGDLSFAPETRLTFIVDIHHWAKEELILF